VFLLPGCSPETSQPVETGQPNHDALFEECVATKDRRIHKEVFATVDNPDVQRELLATRKERAIRECREHYPAP
jgi:hypothetical protein